MMMSCLSVLGSSAKNPGRFGWVIGVSRSRSPRMIIVGAAIFFGSVSGIFVLRSRRTPFGAFGPHCATSLTHVSTAMASEAWSSNRPRALPGVTVRNSSLGAWPLWRAPHGRRVQNESPHLLRMLHGGGDLCGDAETAGVVIGAAVVLVVDGEDVEPLGGEVVHERVGHGRLTRPGKGRRIAGLQPLLPDIEFNRLAIDARNALDPVLGTGN